jgi:hypothetical protein
VKDWLNRPAKDWFNREENMIQMHTYLPATVQDWSTLARLAATDAW